MARIQSSRRLLDVLPDVYFRLDRDLRFTFVSGRCDRVVGVAAATLLGKRLTESKLPCAVRGAIQTCLEDGAAAGLGRAECCDRGRYFRVRLVPDQEPAVTWLGVIEDVTALRWRNERRRLRGGFLRTIATATTEEAVIAAAVCEAREVGAEARWTQPAEAASGFVPVMCDDRVIGALELGFSDGRPWSEEERAFFVTLAQQCGLGISRLRRDEAERLAHDEALAARARVEQEAEVMERMVAVVGHDLRSPLNVILLTADSLGEADRTGRSAKRIQRSARRMQRMIDDLLDVARIRHAGGLPIEPRPMNVIDVIGDQVDEMRRTYPDREFGIDIRTDGRGRWDPGRLAALLSNLLVNAVRYGEPDAIRIALCGDERAVNLHVSNRGQIEPEILPAIFDPFSSGRRRTDGLGLGLFICRAIAQAHGGRIEARCGDGVTEFVTYLPRDR